MEKSRIKFNPVTHEIEIEGSEQFIKTYFDRIEAMISDSDVAASKTETRERAFRRKRRVPRAAGKLLKKSARGGMTRSVMDIIRSSAKGITTAELEDRTGLAPKQIWPIIYRAKSEGKIKQPKRGVYVGG